MKDCSLNKKSSKVFVQQHEVYTGIYSCSLKNMMLYPFLLKYHVDHHKDDTILITKLRCCLPIRYRIAQDALREVHD